MFSRPVGALYADASVLINIIATDVAVELLRTVGVPVLIARPAAEEVVRDPRRKVSGRARLDELVQAGVLEIAELGSEHLGRYVELVGAPGPDDLGDGEAATICAAEISTAAVALDDAKAIRVAAKQCPEVQHVYTVDLLLHACRSGSLSATDCRKALTDARSFARMRIPHVRIADLRALELLAG
jgi:predicted nucleic acid-binding protein